MPQLVARESGTLIQRLAEVTNTRHAKFGKTIFHLEPNLKDGPGGLRDFHVTRWIALIGELAASRAWPVSLQLQQDADDDNVFEAMEFLSSARCYLHYRSGRDENVVSWESQEDLAARGIGSTDGPVSSAEWMRLYFRNANAIYRNASQVLDQVTSHEFGAGTVVPALAVGSVERRIFRGGPASLHPTVGRRARRGSRVALVHFHGASRCEDWRWKPNVA